MLEAEFETVIVGGGACGLALADALHAAGKSFVLFEARERLGGRVLSKKTQSGGVVDLGPTFFWPETQPNMLALVNSLELKYFPQHDIGGVLQLTDPNRAPETVQVASVHGGAHRVEGGMAAVINGLENRLPKETIHLSHQLVSLEQHQDYVTILFKVHHETVEVQAKRVVLAIPPRLLAEHVTFMPKLPDNLLSSMQATHTWMAEQAKAVTSYTAPFWREDGHSGNAFVSHPQAMLSEVFDACDATTAHAALGGFVALPPESREAYKRSIPLLVESQLQQLFGLSAGNGELHYQNWSDEPFTCSSLDYEPPKTHPMYGDQNLRSAYWGGKLYFGGAETASLSGGYLEGALEAATRIKRALLTRSQQHEGENSASLQNFSEWVTDLRKQSQQRYRTHLNHILALQHKEQITQRAVLGAIEQTYNEAIQKVETLPFNMKNIKVEQGRTTLTPIVLAAFSGYSRELVEVALEFNRSSCAISNFPDEASPDAEYMQVILRDLSAAWRDFAISINEALLAKKGNHLELYHVM